MGKVDQEWYETTEEEMMAYVGVLDGKKPGELLSVEAELARLTRSTYPAAQLLQRPLPDGVDPTRLEFYLDPNHFQILQFLDTSLNRYSQNPFNNDQPLAIVI
uniref:Uncharacterized protein n=1 Tax=Timema tahoe TaxID=61484 RepID=A0A7R9IP94_9NEOP|nr:unnamed protein product [Timema tahoe]